MLKLKKNNEIRISLISTSFNPALPTFLKVPMRSLMVISRGMMVQATGRPGYGPEYIGQKK
jgi:hypothetical protein